MPPQKLRYPASGVLRQGPFVLAQDVSFPQAGNSSIIFTTGDMSLLTLGGMSAAALLAATGLTFTRASVSTVQTSASAIDSTPGINVACIGSDGAGHTGLVIQGPTANIMGGAGDNSPRDLSTPSYTSGSGQTLTDPTTSPGACPTGVDGTANACTRAQIASNGFSSFADWGGDVSGRTFSTWQKGTSAPLTGQQVWIDAINTLPIVNPSLTTTFQRVVLSLGANARRFSAVCDCRDYSLVGGTAPTARDVICDAMQVEYGSYVTEAILKGSTSRSPDVVSIQNAASLLDSGQLNMVFRFYPKLASSTALFDNVGGAVGTVYLWSYDANNYARLNLSTLKLEVNAATGTATSANTIGWSANDFVELQVSFGNNIPSIAKYRLNGGSFNDLALPTVTNALTLGASPLAVMNNLGVSQFHQRARMFQALKSGAPMP